MTDTVSDEKLREIVARGAEPIDTSTNLHMVDRWRVETAYLCPDIARELLAAREALRFYANPAVYKPHPHGPAFDDRDLSYLARALLPEQQP